MQILSVARVKEIFPMLLVAAALAAGGCMTPETRIKHHPQVVARVPVAQLEEIKAGRVLPGFDMDQVRLALGRPDSVTIRPTKDRSSHEVWTYRIYEDDTGA